MSLVDLAETAPLAFDCIMRQLLGQQGSVGADARVPRTCKALRRAYADGVCSVHLTQREMRVDPAGAPLSALCSTCHTLRIELRHCTGYSRQLLEKLPASDALLAAGVSVELKLGPLDMARYEAAMDVLFFVALVERVAPVLRGLFVWSDSDGSAFHEAPIRQPGRMMKARRALRTEVSAGEADADLLPVYDLAAADNQLLLGDVPARHQAWTDGYAAGTTGYWPAFPRLRALHMKVFSACRFIRTFDARFATVESLRLLNCATRFVDSSIARVQAAALPHLTHLYVRDDTVLEQLLVAPSLRQIHVHPMDDVLYVLRQLQPVRDKVVAVSIIGSAADEAWHRAAVSVAVWKEVTDLLPSFPGLRALALTRLRRGNRRPALQLAFLSRLPALRRLDVSGNVLAADWRRHLRCDAAVVARDVTLV